jgi:hypothetical protein
MTAHETHLTTFQPGLRNGARSSACVGLTAHRPDSPPPRAGFSLIEITMAILLIGLGVTTLFALFPMGLKQSDDAMVDTHTALFTDKVFSGIRAHASTITNWTDWSDLDRFRALAVSTVEIIHSTNLTHALHGDNSVQKIDHAIAHNTHILYKLNTAAVAGKPYLRSATLLCQVGIGGETYDEDQALWSYTEFFYSGFE